MHNKTSHVIGALLTAVTSLVGPAGAEEQEPPVGQTVERESSSLLTLYRELHQSPELPCEEKETAARMALELADAGFEVTEGVGGTGVVGVARNGDGPTVLVRADMDALPIREETGLAYASKRTATGEDGQPVGVMHACGHDLHMAVFIGTARVLKALAAHWQGTLVLVAQPAEELGAGAGAMLADGLYERFPRPDYALALHIAPGLPAGTIGYVEGNAMANVDGVDIVVRGVGGHGAMPHLARDPVVLAARIILALQTIVSRENAATDPVVVTVGQIHGGTRRNVIPDEVRLDLTVRTYADETRRQVLEAIERVAVNTARAAGIPEDRLPLVTAVAGEAVPSQYNDPELVQRATAAMKAALGPDSVAPTTPWMAAEDFARYGRQEPRIPTFLFFLGSTAAERLARCGDGEAECPGLHSARLSLEVEPTLRTGIVAMSAAVLSLMAPPR